MFSIGHILHDTYRIERLLGQGGMAWVFEVAHVRLPRRFALKVITAPAAKSSEFMLRFRREAEILASLDHPNLVNVVDWNITPSGQPYLVMELLSGEDLAQFLQRSGALPQRVALSIFAQAVAALEVAHSHGITHRDLKPANIFLCKNGLVPHYTKVLDFGIAKSAQHASALVTDHLVLMGTPAYMAPEQARGDVAGVDARADQFSLGLVLYEMLSGKPAFYRRGEPAMTTLCRVMLEDPAPLTDAAMNQAVMRALRKQPEERYRSISEMVTGIMNAASVPVEHIEIPERTERTERRRHLAPLADAASPPPERRASPPSVSAPARAPEPPPQASAPPEPPLGEEPTSPRGNSQLAALVSPPDAETKEAPIHVPPEPPRRPYRPRRPLYPLLLSSGTVAALLVMMALLMRHPEATSAHQPETSAEETAPPPGSDMSALVDSSATSDPPDLGQCIDLVHPPTPPAPVTPIGHSVPPVHFDLRMSGVVSRSIVGQVLGRCVRSAFDPLRRFADSTIELRRIADKLLVPTRNLPAERCRQLELCLLEHKAELVSVPPSIDIKIVESRSP